MSSKKFSSIILSAGFSSRMGDFKPLLRFGSATILEYVIELFSDAGIKDISVVTGYKSDELTEILKSKKVSFIHNPDYEQGMFSSVKAGVSSLNKCDAFFVLPVDIPLIRHHTIKSLMNAYSKDNPDIVYPVFQNKRGHPPLISNRITNNILQYKGEGGLGGLLKQFTNVIDHRVPDNGILLDCDTPEDYEYLSKRLVNFHIPSLNECREIIKIYNTDFHIVKHCESVTALAVFLAKEVNLSQEVIELVKAAGLLHDLVRKEKNHAIEGELIIENLGFPEVANIIESHMDIQIDKQELLVDASQIIYLADKLIDGTEIINLEERFAEKIKTAKNDEIRSAIRKRLDNALAIKERVEQICKKKFDILLAKYKQKNRDDLFTQTW